MIFTAEMPARKVTQRKRGAMLGLRMLTRFNCNVVQARGGADACDIFVVSFSNINDPVL